MNEPGSPPDILAQPLCCASFLSFFPFAYMAQPSFPDRFVQDVALALKALGKSSWPELVGVDGEAAAATIERENPHVNAIVLLDGTPVTKDFRCDRVWVWVDNYRKVIREPRIG